MGVGNAQRVLFFTDDEFAIHSLLMQIAKKTEVEIVAKSFKSDFFNIKDELFSFSLIILSASDFFNYSSWDFKLPFFLYGDENYIGAAFLEGASDYICDPLSYIELAARIDSFFLKRSFFYYKGLFCSFIEGGFFVNNILISLSCREREVVRLLFFNRGLIFSAEIIREKIGIEEGVASVVMMISRIKQKFGDYNILLKNLIESRYGRGYYIAK